MALIETMFVMVCASTPANYNQACNKTVDATTRQVGIRQEVDKYEDLSMKFADKEARHYLGDTSMSATAVALAVYRYQSGQGFIFNTKAPILCDTIQGSINGTTSTYGFTLNWNFK